MKGELQNGKIVISDNPTISKLYGKRSYGVLVDKKLYLTPLEAYYLSEKEKLQIEHKGDPISGAELLSLTDAEEGFEEKYTVYKDLRDRGYIVKTGFKYGCHFRVYRNSIEDHAEYLVHSFIEHGSIKVDDIMKQARLAHSVKKKMVMALVDEENDITYFSVDRVKI
ncbi:MAG TPA: tRNA-intron lyase [Candidatus Methanofastidiosa archaeon]|nr:tRNA-intron lyase [Candidatus Methanofastidiosa archaeon]HPR40962.1 tRNA-intron lyase [Candidatus Methanofastidiosa archaeon]